METSIFSNKAQIPDNDMLSEALGIQYNAWIEIRNYVFTAYPNSVEEWYSQGQKNGWNFRIKDRKRPIIYMLPREKYFLVAFVFGEKATADSLESDISREIKEIIKSARVYAEGRGFRIELRNLNYIEDIKKLIDIKLSN
jgi:hypothetical protein